MTLRTVCNVHCALYVTSHTYQLISSKVGKASTQYIFICQKALKDKEKYDFCQIIYMLPNVRNVTFGMAVHTLIFSQLSFAAL